MNCNLAAELATERAVPAAAHLIALVALAFLTHRYRIPASYSPWIQLRGPPPFAVQNTDCGFR